MSTGIEHLEHRIKRVKNKVAERKINLNSCLTPREIEEFEKRYRIHLPQDYSRFLIEIGNGGSGPPYYGFMPLAGTIKTVTDKKFRPDLPFPLTEDWVWEDQGSWENGSPDSLDPIFLHGHLCLGTEGCGEDWILIVTGRERGNIWNRVDVGAISCAPKRDFLSWYEYWLDGNDDWWKNIELAIPF
jgi:hypothetical protein